MMSILGFHRKDQKKKNHQIDKDLMEQKSVDEHTVKLLLLGMCFMGLSNLILIEYFL